MAKFIPEHIKPGFSPDDDKELDEQSSTEEMYEDLGVFTDDDEEKESDIFAEVGEYIPKSDAEISLIREITGILTDAKFNLDEIEVFVKEIDFSLPRHDIIDAFKKFVKTDLSIKFELEYLYPVFIELAKPRIIKDLKVKTATEIVGEGIPGGVPVSYPSDHVTKDRKLKPENELPQLVTSDAVRSKYVDMMMKGKEITCKLCGKVIEADEMRTWWLSIYPAHMDCVHAELNRRAASAGRELPFPE